MESFNTVELTANSHCGLGWMRMVAIFHPSRPTGSCRGLAKKVRRLTSSGGSRVLLQVLV